MTRPVWQQRLLLLCKIVLAGGLMAWLLLSGKLQLGRLASVPLDWRLAALFMITIAAMLLPAFRWWWLLRIQGLQEPFGKVIGLTWAGYLAALVLPGAAGGDLARGYLILRRHASARARAFSTVVADRFLGLYSLFFIGTLSAVWLLIHNPNDRAIQLITILTIGPLIAMTAGLVAMLCAPTRKLLFRVVPSSWHESWDKSFRLYRDGIPRLVACFGLALASSALTLVSVYIAGDLLGASVPISHAFIAGPLVIFANCLPITPGGIGLAEATSYQIFSSLGSSNGAEIQMLLRTCAALTSVLGVVWLFSFTRRVPSTRLIGSTGAKGSDGDVAETQPAFELRSPIPADYASKVPM